MSVRVRITVDIGSGDEAFTLTLNDGSSAGDNALYNASEVRKLITRIAKKLDLSLTSLFGDIGAERAGSAYIRPIPTETELRAAAPRVVPISQKDRMALDDWRAHQ